MPVINVRTVQYKLICITETGLQLDLTNAVKDLGWSETEKELAAKVTFTLLNVDFRGQKLSKIVKLGCRAIVMADW